MSVAAHEHEPAIDEPIVFRTASVDVCKSTLETGSLWLRSGHYYRHLEDEIRNDQLEGINCGTTSVPFTVAIGGVNFKIEGSGAIGQEIRPHYLVSLHGTSISAAQRTLFGGHTFGVLSLSRLSIEILFQVSQQIRCSGYRWGQVSYQYTALALSLCSNGSPINLGGNPPLSFGPLNTDVLRKLPVKPFIDQDEWRIVIFTEGYLGNDATAPLKISVAPAHFYPIKN